MKRLLAATFSVLCFFSAAHAAAGVDARISEALKGIERNTSPAVDAIALAARADAKEISEEVEMEAVLFIRNNFPNYYKDAVTMEKTIYYGSLLDKAFKDDRGRLGWAALKAVKYVYRGYEKVSDEATQINLRKVEKTLKRLEP